MNNKHAQLARKNPDTLITDTTSVIHQVHYCPHVGAAIFVFEKTLGGWDMYRSGTPNNLYVGYASNLTAGKAAIKHLYETSNASIWF